MKQQDKILEAHLEQLKRWNKKRAETEKRGIEKFWMLKELFKKNANK